MPELPTYEDALQRSLERIHPIDREELVPCEEADGRVLCESILADRDLPPFDRAALDGYALRYEDLATGNTFPVATTIAAGQPADVSVPPGQCVAIATGAPVPADLDTVIQHELSDRGDRDGGPVHFEGVRIDRGNAIHPRGADARRDDVLVPPGTKLDPDHIGLAATVGATMLPVRCHPVVRILTSGDEVVPPDMSPLPHQIRNGNGPMLGALVQRMGGRVHSHSHLEDEPLPVQHALKEAISASDIVVTVGGISAGDRDHIPGALEQLEIESLVSGAAIQPGRPVRIGQDSGGTVVVSLPGNPVSVLATACLFLWPVLRRLVDLDPVLPWRLVTLGEAVQPSPRRWQFRPASVNESGEAVVPTWQGSGDLAHAASTDGLLALPRQEEAVEEGTPLRFLPWP